MKTEFSWRRMKSPAVLLAGCLLGAAVQATGAGVRPALLVGNKSVDQLVRAGNIRQAAEGGGSIWNGSR